MIRSKIKKIMEMPVGMKASVAFFFASMITSGISYIVTPVYTRLLTPDVFGQTTVFLTWVQIFGILAMFCLSNGIFNNGMVDYPDKRDEYSLSMLALSNIITIIFSIIIILFYPHIERYIGIDFSLVVLMCVLFLVQPAYNFWTARQRYEFRYKYTVIWTVLCALLSPAIAIICIIIFNDNQLYARLFGAELTLIAIYVFFYVYIWIKGKCRIKVEYWKTAFKFNLPLIPHYLSTYLIGNSNKILISNIVGNAATAYYSVAQSIATVAIIAWGAINSSLLPYTYENCKSGNFKAISKVVTPILGGFAVICTVIIMFAPEVIVIMGDNDYVEAMYVIPPIVGGVFFQVQYYIYANIVFYYKKPKYVMCVSVVSMIVNLMLGYVAVRNFGYLAAGYVTLICYFLQACLDYFALRKVVKEDVYDMKIIGLLSLIVVIISITSSAIYKMALLRYSIITIILIITIISKNKIISFLKRIR